VLLKGILCGLLYPIFHLLIIYTQYILDISLYSALVLGILCGTAIALVSYSSTVRKTVIAMLLGLFFCIVMDVVLLLSGIPYQILMYIFRDNEAIQRIGHLTVNELIGYNFGRLFFFYPGLLITFIVLIILIPALLRKKNRAKEE